LNAPLGLLDAALDRAFAGLREAREGFALQLAPREVGTITSVATGIVKVSGLPGVGFEELVRFPGDRLGIAFNLDEVEVGVVLLGDYQDLHAGDEVERTGRVMDIAVGDGLLGRVLDPLGKPLDGKGPLATDARLPVERPAPPIMDRAPVSVPLQTGLKVVDALIPIGRGQRELILGDRQTGKTAIAIDTILNQRGTNVVCVYCAIGQRASSVAKVVASLREKGAMDYTVVVAAEGNEAPGVAYVTPYAATSIAESFMEKGRDVLIVYDDLTHHARAYRELSLLLRRPPGREAFPGDIFYIHSRLLERSTHLRKERGGGSLTALPIIETDAQDISAYIPTNLISITDRGRRTRACLKQAESQPVSMLEQIVVLLALTAGLFDPIPLERVTEAEQALRRAAASIPPDLAGRFASTDKMSDADRKATLDLAGQALASFQPPAAATVAGKPSS
jgi:F-type H+-transporting ATPase subunit alpha